MYALRRRLLRAVSPDSMEAIARWVSAQAAMGDLEAARLVLEYCVGKAPTPVEVSGPGGQPLRSEVDWPRAQRAILEALAPFEEARLAVAARLGEMLGNDAHQQSDHEPGSDRALSGPGPEG
jgi:hypothetical protein